MVIGDGLWHAPSTKTRVPRQVEPSGHCRNLGVTLSYSNDGLGAARGQRFRKGPCASYPTRLFSFSSSVNLSFSFFGIAFKTNGKGLASDTMRVD